MYESRQNECNRNRWTEYDTTCRVIKYNLSKLAPFCINLYCFYKQDRIWKIVMTLFANTGASQLCRCTGKCDMKCGPSLCLVNWANLKVQSTFIQVGISETRNYYCLLSLVTFNSKDETMAYHLFFDLHPQYFYCIARKKKWVQITLQNHC